MTRDPVAAKKEPLQGYVTKDIKFGVSTGEQKEGWTGAQCVVGDYKTNERFPDVDLGKSRKFKQTVQPFGPNDGHERDPERSFGIPSIRNDIDKRGIKSVADPLNYGGEADAKELLKPKEYVYYNITGEELFNRKFELYQIEKYFKETGVDISKYYNEIIEFSKLRGQYKKYTIKLVLDFLQTMGIVK